VLANNAGMKITDLPTAELLRVIRATECSSDPDHYALRVLHAELSRRLGVPVPAIDTAIKGHEPGEVPHAD
jgi:hypothetical protein